ncbi:hypothetical protein ACFFF1_08250 [Listeria seeligeri]|uniref:hypothetical protein n=1 Tax=Listeria seeligeri TaxID=1640 RepID=UPI0001C4EC47|nr:hypothetical protein [Listeria seeligeri]CBH27747.1 conserved hypothetical protein [Listeria seeligeri serovar 1/2b str. SLCC3954]
MTKIVKVMKKNKDDSVEQVYTETHVNAVTGLSEFINGHDILGVSSINNQTGAVILKASDLNASEIAHVHADATSSTAGFMSAEDKSKLDGFSEGAGITEQRAEDLINNALSQSSQIILTTVKELDI